MQLEWSTTGCAYDIAAPLPVTVDVPIITASQRGHDMGRHSVDILLGRIANPDLPAQQRFLKAELNFKQDAPVDVGGTGE